MKAFKYVPESQVEDYFKMGWVMSDRPLMYEGDYLVWLMVWLCECKIPFKKRFRK